MTMVGNSVILPTMCGKRPFALPGTTIFCSAFRRRKLISTVTMSLEHCDCFAAQETAKQRTRNQLT